MAYDAKALRKKQFDERTAKRMEAQRKKGGIPTQAELQAQAIVASQTSGVSGTTPQKATPTTNQPKVIRDQDTGKITFVETADGKFIHGSSKEIRNILAKKSEEAKTPEGAVEASQVARQSQLQDLISQQPSAQQDLGVQGEPGIKESTIKAGLGGVATNAQMIGAGVGGAIGLVGGPPGAAIGAIVGAAAGTFIQNFTRKLKEEQTEKIKAEYDSVGKSQTAINKRIRYVRMGGDPVLAWSSVQDHLAAIDQAESQIKLESNEDLNLFLSVDGSDELASIRNWNEQIRPNIELLFLQAAQNPSGSNDPTELLDLSEFD